MEKYSQRFGQRLVNLFNVVYFLTLYNLINYRPSQYVTQKIVIDLDEPQGDEEETYQSDSPGKSYTASQYTTLRKSSPDRFQEQDANMLDHPEGTF